MIREEQTLRGFSALVPYPTCISSPGLTGFCPRPFQGPGALSAAWSGAPSQSPDKRKSYLHTLTSGEARDRTISYKLHLKYSCRPTSPPELLPGWSGRPDRAGPADAVVR